MVSSGFRDQVCAWKYGTDIKNARCSKAPYVEGKKT